jgi:hypothetical protein
MNARDDKALASPSPKRPKAARAGQGAGAPAPLFGTSTRTPPRSLAPVSAARQRKLHVGHFAFMRSVVQGLDPRESWERYFRVEGEATDQRTVRATIAWIRDEFAAAAKREDRFGTARLVRIDATRIADPSLELPSLEAFAEAHGLEDERQADQIAAYEAEYGRATQRLRRRARLIARQLEALRWLESLVAQSPKAGDSVAAWLNPTLASHLEAPTSSRSPSWSSASTVSAGGGTPASRRWGRARPCASSSGCASIRTASSCSSAAMWRCRAASSTRTSCRPWSSRPPTSARWRSSSCRPSSTAPAACTGARRRSAC